RVSGTANWRESSREGGTPGAQNSSVSENATPVAEIVPVVVVPVLPTSPPPQEPVEPIVAPIQDSVAEVLLGVSVEQQGESITELPSPVQGATTSSVAVPVPALVVESSPVTEGKHAPVKEQIAKKPVPIKIVAKNNDIGENDALAVQRQPQDESPQAGASQPALAASAFGQNIYILIAGAFGLLVWLSLRRRPAPVMEEEINV
ncbi:MAG: hypothetical protein NUV61_03310, partial [Candidatus Azambacteria bacterium]|nr:hypothetical protein [Candidatus Azambacteria bacterium]